MSSYLTMFDSWAAPGLTAGRGLKPSAYLAVRRIAQRAAPGLTAGRGLKPGNRPLSAAADSGSARPHGWARIETPAMGCASALLARRAAPGLTAGRGLKLVEVNNLVSPTLQRPASRLGED